MMTGRTILTIGAVAFCAFAAACGGGPDAADLVTDASGNAVVTAGGTAVTQEGLNRWNAALAAYQRFDGQGWNAARCAESLGNFESAIEAQGGQFTEAIYMAGLSVANCGDEERARSFYNRALEVNDKFCKARAALGVMVMDDGRTQEAMAIFQRALRDDNRCTEAYVNIAVIQRQAGGAQVREALNNLRRALAIDSRYLPAFNQMALLYLEQAETAENPQMLDLAGVVCRQAQLIDRDYAPIYNTWGLINMQKANVIEATQLFQRAIRLDGSMFEAHMNFGQIVLSFRGYEDARTAFTRAVALRGDNYDAHIGLGAALRGLRQLPEAQQEYERAVELDANRPEAYFNLGLLYQDYMSGSIEDLNRAKRYYNTFMSKAGGNARFASTVEDVRRTCRVQTQARRGNRRRQRRRSSDCRPGRMQNIDTAVEALTAVAEMEARSRQQQSGGGGG